ncbi:MAG: hypothetical protein K8F93_00070 [Burkholderiales bacterium]|nr:hypothetical protein [Burkholderiales bacterium]MCL4687699.1 hypothetical protein [Burkholderiales bacterium]
MSDQDEGKGGFMSRIRLWLRGEIVDQVPSDIAACEFHCRVDECLHDKWETCENRLRAARDGE